MPDEIAIARDAHGSRTWSGVARDDAGNVTGEATGTSPAAVQARLAGEVYDRHLRRSAAYAARRIIPPPPT